MSCVSFDTCRMSKSQYVAKCGGPSLFIFPPHYTTGSKAMRYTVYQSLNVLLGYSRLCQLGPVTSNSLKRFGLELELCADVIVSAAARWSISVCGGAARRGVGGQKHLFLRFTKKFRSILKIF